ncbi:MAG TPA: MSMEG_4193 family putative phosphomutase [Actinomycetota bacterium]
MTLFLLIRHAVTDVTGKRLSGSLPGIHLSAEGREQAARLAQRLVQIRFTDFYSSPLERCVETAEAIAGPRGMTVHSLPDLEEVGYGQWSGRSVAQLARTALWKRLHQTPSAVRFPDGETLAEVQRRCVGAVDEIARQRPRGTIGLVTHADVIRLLVAHYGGIHLDLFQRFTVSPASVTAVALGDRIPRILRINDLGTVEDLAAVARRIAARRPVVGSGNHPAQRRSANGPPRRRS